MHAPKFSLWVIFASSPSFTENLRITYFLVLRSLGNEDNSRVSALQIALRPCQGVQKWPLFIFKISQILNKSHDSLRTLKLPHF